MFTRELQDRMDYIGQMSNIAPFPKGGSNGIYVNELVGRIIQLTGNQQKLFWVLVSDTDEYNQCHRTREQIGSVYMKKYNRTRISIDISRLVELEMVAIVGSVVMVNPFIFIPSIKEPKLKAVIQRCWEELVMY